MSRTRYMHRFWPAGSLVVPLPTSAMHHFWVDFEQHRKWFQPILAQYPCNHGELKRLANVVITHGRAEKYAPETLANRGILILSRFMEPSRDLTQSSRAFTASFSPCCFASSFVKSLPRNRIIFVLTSLSYWVNTTSIGTIWLTLLSVQRPNDAIKKLTSLFLRELN